MKEHPFGRFALLVAVFGFALGLGPSTNALAADEPARKRPSTELFDAGLDEMKIGHFESGCRLLGESYALEPLLGTLFTLAECEARRGRLETALAHFREFEEKVAALPESERSSQARRLEAVAERRQTIEPRRAYLDLRLRGRLVATHEISIDERRIDPTSLARPLPLDSGMHQVLVRLAERESRATVELREGATVALEVVLPAEQAAPEPKPEPNLQPKEAVPTPRAENPAPLGSEPLPPKTTNPEAARSSSWTYLSLGLGVVGVGVAGLSTFVLLAKKPTLDAECPNRVCKSEEGLNAARDVGAWDTLGTIGAVGGVVGFGLFTYFVLSDSGKKDDSRATLRLDAIRAGGTLSVEGTF